MDEIPSSRTVIFVYQRNTASLLYLLSFSVLIVLSLIIPTPAFSVEPTSTTTSQSSPLNINSVLVTAPQSYTLVDSGEIILSSVELWDLIGGFEIPLTGEKVAVTENKTIAYLPELEQGEYELRWDGVVGPGSEKFSIQVKSFTTNGDLVIRSESTPTDTKSQPIWILALSGISLGFFLLVILRRKLPIALTVFFILSGAGISLAFIAQDDNSLSLATCRSLPDGSQERFGCLRDYAFTTASTPTAMMDLIDNLRNDYSLSGDSEQHTCHNVGHLLGRLLVEKKYPIDEIVIADRGLCDYGLLHGALENAGRMMSDSQWGEVLVSVCSTFIGEAALQCAHGAGHGTSIRTNGSINSSLDLCDKMSGENPELLLWQCATGVFMGYSNRTVLAYRFPNLIEMRDSLPQPQEFYMPAMCSEYTGVIRKACWLAAFQFLGSSSLGILEQDERFTNLNLNVDYCASMPDAGDCIQGLMVRVREKSVGRSDIEVLRACARYEGDLWNNCILGFIQSEVSRLNESTASDRFQQVQDLCDIAEFTKPGSLPICLESVNSLASHLK
jgi:hypothetical protein